MKKIIKKSHVLVVGAGPNLRKYWDSIDNFIKKNNAVTIGINRINSILTPDYHFWLDIKRYKKFGREINKKSRIIFGEYIGASRIKRHWDGDYEIIKYSKNEQGSVRYNRKNNKFYGDFRSAGSLAILWSHIKDAKKISVVGMDGYTYNSKEELLEGRLGQHCYSQGLTDQVAVSKKYKRLNNDQFYNHCLEKDDNIYITLKSIKKYGVNFEIITPTIYKDFYNADVLNIKE